MSIHDFSTTFSSRIIGNQSVVLEVPNTNFSLRLIGSTMPTNVDVIRAGETGVNQIVFYPKPGEDGLVALCISLRQGANYVPVFYRVVWKEKDGVKYPFIRLNESWVAPERIGHVTPCSVDVVIKGKHFSSRETTDTIYVPDSNLLCRYMLGTASALEVLHAAIQKKVEAIADRSTKQLVQEKMQLIREVEELNNECSYHVHKIGQLQDEMSGYTELQEAVKQVCNWFDSLPTWLQPQSIRDLIKVVNGK